MSGENKLRLRDLDSKTHVANGLTDKSNHSIDDKRDSETDVQTQSCCFRLHTTLGRCCSPCLKSQHPLPEHPNLFQRLRHAFMLPPKGNLAFYLQFVIVCVQIWIVLYAFTNGEALPGGNFFSLLILFVCCAVGGYLTSFVHLPPLLGMLIVGVMLRNLPGVKVIGENIDTKWSGVLRKVALTVILTRAGLGLDVVKLKKLSFAMLRLAFLPSLAEIVTVTVVSHFLMGFPWKWSMLLGCILGALSPAVTVPILVNLQDRRYGAAKGIPTMLLAAGGLDNVLCVTGFSVFFGIIFSEGIPTMLLAAGGLNSVLCVTGFSVFFGIIFSDGDLAVTIIKGPAGVVLGIVYGFVAGIFLWYIPSKDSPNSLFYRAMLLFGFGLVAIFGSSVIGLSGAGPLGCLTTATVAAYKWRQRRQPGETDELAGVMALTWLIVQHFLFGLIGSAVNIGHIQSKTAGYGIATLAIGLVVRSALSFTVTLGTGFNLKERIFVTLTWLSKATVQAAIGGLALDKVRSLDTPDPEQEAIATDVLTLSVLAIVICAPIGATLMSIIGPRVLEQGDQEEVEVGVEAQSNDRLSQLGDGSVSIEMEKAAIDDRRISNISGISLEDMDNFKSELTLALANNANKQKLDRDPTTATADQTEPASNGGEMLVELNDDSAERNLPQNDELTSLDDMATETGFINPAYTDTDTELEEATESGDKPMDDHADKTGETDTNTEDPVEHDLYNNNDGSEIYKTVLNISMKGPSE